MNSCELKEKKLSSSYWEIIPNTLTPYTYLSESNISEYIFVILLKSKISIQNSSQFSTSHALSKHYAKF